jgi:hypothetical protein
MQSALGGMHARLPQPRGRAPRGGFAKRLAAGKAAAAAAVPGGGGGRAFDHAVEGAALVPHWLPVFPAARAHQGGRRSGGCGPASRALAAGLSVLRGTR